MPAQPLGKVEKRRHKSTSLRNLMRFSRVFESLEKSERPTSFEVCD
jgi:hypothetical protein